jgi:hypothetical protein
MLLLINESSEQRLRRHYFISPNKIIADISSYLGTQLAKESLSKVNLVLIKKENN